MPKLDNDQFITELSKLFLSCREAGSVFITMKQVHVKSDGKVVIPGRPVPADAEPRCLVRATDGAHANTKQKFSTLVRPKDLIKFQLAYLAVVKSNADNLKKREKKRKNAKKAGRV